MKMSGSIFSIYHFYNRPLLIYATETLTRVEVSMVEPCVDDFCESSVSGDSEDALRVTFLPPSPAGLSGGTPPVAPPSFSRCRCDRHFGLMSSNGLSSFVSVLDDSEVAEWQ